MREVPTKNFLQVNDKTYVQLIHFRRYGFYQSEVFSHQTQTLVDIVYGYMFDSNVINTCGHYEIKLLI